MKKMGFIIIVAIILLILFMSGPFVFRKETKTVKSKIKYMPIGDSYTIGEGIGEHERWPNQLVKNLRNQDVEIEILDNPAVSGFTVSDAIMYELPVVKNLKPDIVTVLIGANDNFQMMDIKIFEKEYEMLIDEIQGNMADPRNILIITIPDHTVSPAFNMYGGAKDASQSIALFNDSIKRIAKERNLLVADIFPVSQKMKEQVYFSTDGLHPSASGYAKWEEIIRQRILDLLNK